MNPRTPWRNISGPASIIFSRVRGSNRTSRSAIGTCLSCAALSITFVGLRLTCRACGAAINHRTAGIIRATANISRFREFMPLRSSGLVNIPAPLMLAAAITRFERPWATANACGPPPENPATRKRSMPSESANCRTSCDQSVRRRCGWKVDSPTPGRSGAIILTLDGVSLHISGTSSREPGSPWKRNKGG